jgi:hypothetical protein
MFTERERIAFAMGMMMAYAEMMVAIKNSAKQ